MKNVIATVVLFSFALITLVRCGKEYSPPLPALVDFNFDVKPILVQKCYLCHGPDPESRKGGLRLDTFEGATAALKEGGFAVVPGHVDDSELVGRIYHTDPEMMMPPPESKLKLTEREIAILTRWIKQGAEWKPHWAFIQPKLPDLNGLADEQNVIDYFVEKEILKNGLELAPQASKNSLVRRVSYILTGLPPTTDDVEKFLADKDEKAYEKMVDQYLNSPRFGEKWARHWMDVVRYAETKGHEFDYTIDGAWRYRDYLIKAFNSDVPYDQFVMEHLAGDLLKTPRRDPSTGTNESQIGTVIYALAEGTHSPVDVRKDESDRIDNMIDVTTKTFQGLTVSCARCHDHKFDPIKTKDYYALYGIMESTRFSPLPAARTLSQEENLAKAGEIKKHLRTLMADKWNNESSTRNAKPKAIAKKGSAPDSAADYQVIGDFRGADLRGWKSNGSAFGDHSTLGNPKFNRQGEVIELEDGRASSRSISSGIFGALRSPNFILDKNFVGVRARGKKSSVRIIIDNFQLIQDPIFGGMDQKVESEEWQNFRFDVTMWKGHKAYIEILPGSFRTHVFNLPKDAYVEAQYAVAFNDEWVEPPIENEQDPAPAKIAIDHWVEHKASPAEVGLINEMIRGGLLTRKFPVASELLAQSSQLTGNFSDSAFFNGVYDGFGINSPVFKRGNHNDVTKPVPRKFLSALPAKDSIFKTEGSGRAEFAESIINIDNPLTARVMVNRIWHHLFGRGIVETTDNFGLQGKLPSHPELLDFLAIKFQEDGWSCRKLIKLIVMSEAFRRSVEAHEANTGRDPDNLLLSHFPKRRLAAEDVRDALLAVSGRLDTTMYGKPVQVFITDFMQGRGRPKNSGPLDGNGRRSIYQEVRRNFLDPMMVTFDRPIPFTAFGKRNVTNVPAQALTLLNDPFVIQQAEVMAKDIMSIPKLSLEERTDLIFRRAFSRKPTGEEIAQAKTFLLSLAKLHHINEGELLNNINIWKDYCHSIFNSKEFIFLI